MGFACPQSWQRNVFVTAPGQISMLFSLVSSWCFLLTDSAHKKPLPSSTPGNTQLCNQAEWALQFYHCNPQEFPCTSQELDTSNSTHNLAFLLLGFSPPKTTVLAGDVAQGACVRPWVQSLAPYIYENALKHSTYTPNARTPLWSQYYYTIISHLSTWPWRSWSSQPLTDNVEMICQAIKKGKKHV